MIRSLKLPTTASVSYTLREYRPSLGYYTRDGLLSQDRKVKFL
nr:MAG TPA: hypothetical protein [Caudoviricetes sp.]